MSFYDVMVSWVLPFLNLGLLIYFQIRFFQTRRDAIRWRLRAGIAEHIAWVIVRVGQVTPTVLLVDPPFADPEPEHTESLVETMKIALRQVARRPAPTHEAQ